MPTLNSSQRDAVSTFTKGIKVSRATAALPQTAAAAIFTVAGGRVWIQMLLGEVTTVIQTQANNTKLSADPTVGSTVDMCAVKDITGLEAGGKLVLNGTAATALTQANAGAIISQTVPQLVAVGSILLDCAASSTGSIKWDLVYVPFDEGATVTAA